MTRSGQLHLDKVPNMVVEIVVSRSASRLQPLDLFWSLVGSWSADESQ